DLLVAAPDVACGRTRYLHRRHTAPRGDRVVDGEDSPAAGDCRGPAEPDRVGGDPAWRGHRPGPGFPPLPAFPRHLAGREITRSCHPALDHRGAAPQVAPAAGTPQRRAIAPDLPRNLPIAPGHRLDTRRGEPLVARAATRFPG